MSTTCYTRIKLKTGLLVPCGKCPNCAKRYASGWSFRLLTEEKYSDTAYFLTLTYNSNNVEYTANGYKTLNKDHLRAFWKALRKKNTNKLKYYAVGEYGSKTNRPHYHAIIFNADLKSIIGHAPAYALQSGLIPMDGKTELDSKLWKHGYITIGRVNELSVGYALKYMLKKLTRKKHARDDRQIEFSAMSKKLGSQYLTKQARDYHISDLTNRFSLKLSNGALAPMPRYYKQHFYNNRQLETIAKHYEQKAIDEFNNLSTEEFNKKWTAQIASQQRDMENIPDIRDII